VQATEPRHNSESTKADIGYIVEACINPTEGLQLVDFLGSPATGAPSRGLVRPSKDRIRGESAEWSSETSSTDRLLVLMPALDEAAAISRVLTGVKATLERGGVPYELLVIDGRSRDNTTRIASETGARVLTQPGRGKGDAVRFGFGLADGHSRILLMDADGTYPPEEIPQFLSALDGGADVVVGSRMDGIIEDAAMPPLHFIGNRLLSLIARTLYGKSVSDVCSGMWAFSSDAVQRLSLNANHFEIEAELFAQASKAGLRIDEVPIRYRRRMGRPKIQSLRAGLSIATKLIRKRFAP